MTNNIQNLILQNIQLGEDNNKKLLPLQFSILEKLKCNGYVFVFDEVGCGKTVEAGIAIWDCLKNNEEKVLIVCPSNLVFNWYEEMLLKIGLDFKIIGGTKNSVDLYSDESFYYNKLNEISNLCIITYDSKKSENSNAALDRIKKLEIQWDLIVLDEGHDSKNDASNRYSSLENLKTSKVLFLSATPIKTDSTNLYSEAKLVSKLLGKEVYSGIDPVLAISFNNQYPISRNFKEIVREGNEFRKRNVIEVSYKISNDLEDAIKKNYNGMELDRNLGCIFRFNKIFHQNADWIKVYQRFLKLKYSDDDLNLIRSFDNKLDNLIKKTAEILETNIKNKVVIFCNHREVIDYLKKALTCHFGENSIEAMHGETYTAEERKNRIVLLDKAGSEMEQKRILVISHNIGVVGINLSKFNHLFNYQLPDTPADLEQRFGRIDRVTNLDTFKELNMYYFADDNMNFDIIYYNRILYRLKNEVLPFMPSKNLLYSSESYKNWILKVFKELEMIIAKSQFEDIDKDNLRKLGLSTELNLQKITNIVDNYYKQIGFTEDDNLEEKIKEDCEKRNCTIEYQGHFLTYKELQEKCLTDEYVKFKKQITKYDQEIIELTTEINKNKTFESIISYVLNKIGQDGVSNNMVFAVLYNVWKSWKFKDECEGEISFEKFIAAYNKGV